MGSPRAPTKLRRCRPTPVHPRKAASLCKCRQLCTGARPSPAKSSGAYQHTACSAGFFGRLRPNLASGRRSTGSRMGSITSVRCPQMRSHPGPRPKWAKVGRNRRPNAGQTISILRRTASPVVKPVNSKAYDDDEATLCLLPPSLLPPPAGARPRPCRGAPPAFCRRPPSASCWGARSRPRRCGVLTVRLINSLGAPHHHSHSSMSLQMMWPVLRHLRIQKWCCGATGVR